MSNPIQQTSVNNAHGHKKNHPAGLAATQKTIGILEAMPKNRTYSLYPTRQHINGLCDEFNINAETLYRSDVWKKVLDRVNLDYNEMIAFCGSRRIPVAYVYFDQNSLPYTWNQRSLDRFMIKHEPVNHPDELTREFDQIFCHNSQCHWDHSDSEYVWDLRERVALNIRPFQFDTMSVDDRSCHRIYCRDLWTDTEKVMLDLLDALDLKIDHQRLSAWRPIAESWKNIHGENLWFPDNLTRIIDAIINGSALSLPELTLKQECIIQHCLIYQHGVNLKTWNLVKFPNSTLELHSLLEPNTHKINAY